MEEKMEINRDNRTVQTFDDIGPLQELGKIEGLYRTFSQDINSLRDVLLQVSHEVVLCPSNGTWRFAATIGPREKQIAIFFPHIFSKTAPEGTNPSKGIALGTSGNVKSKKITRFCKQVARVLKEGNSK